MNGFDLPKTWLKNSVARALTEGGTAFIEEIANEFTTAQLSQLISVLQRVRDSRKKSNRNIKVEKVG